MKRTARRLCSAALVASIVLVRAAGAAADADVGNDVIKCGTVTATLAIDPPLAFVATPVPATIRIKGKLDGCVDVSNPGVLIDSGSFRGTLTGMTNDCRALTDTRPVSGTLTYQWKADKTTPIVQKSSVQAVSGLTAESFVPAAVDPAFTGVTYLDLTLGTGVVSGAFTGGDAGATSSNVAVTSESKSFFTAHCAAPGGIKTLHVGIGRLVLQ